MRVFAPYRECRGAPERKLVLWDGKKNVRLEAHARASMVVEWLGIRLSTRDTHVQILVREDHVCQGVAKHACRSYLSPRALEPMVCNKGDHHNEKLMYRN